MQVCFIGHKKIDKNEALSSLLKETIELLIHKGATTFLFGSSGEFDHLSWETIT